MFKLKKIYILLLLICTPILATNNHIDINKYENENIIRTYNEYINTNMLDIALTKGQPTEIDEQSKYPYKAIVYIVRDKETSKHYIEIFIVNNENKIKEITYTEIYREKEEAIKDYLQLREYINKEKYVEYVEIYSPLNPEINNGTWGHCIIKTSTDIRTSISGLSNILTIRTSILVK